MLKPSHVSDTPYRDYETLGLYDLPLFQRGCRCVPITLRGVGPSGVSLVLGGWLSPTRLPCGVILLTYSNVKENPLFTFLVQLNLINL